MIDHLASHPRAAIFGRMGSGKTLAALTAVSIAAELDEAPVLVLGPRRVALKTWPDEAAAWPHLKHLRVSPVIGSQAQRADALRVKADVYTMNYENLPWLVERFGSKWPFRTIVADESTRLKNFRTRQGGQRSGALGKVAWLPQVKRWINLTGTPSPNGLQDLWGQTWFLDRGRRLGNSYSAFTDRWFSKGFNGYGMAPTKWAQRQIQERLADICLTIDPRDYIEFPDPIMAPVKVELPKKARAFYRELETSMFAELNGMSIEAFSAAARTMKCLQVANGAVYTDDKGSWAEVHQEKLDALESVISEAGGTPVLVAYNFKSDLARLKKRFPDGRQFDKDPRTETAWNEGRIPIMFIHPASGGHGVNLQYGGNILAFFGHWWDLEQRDQVIERIGPLRQWQSGKGRNVYIYDIIAEKTLDEDVLARHTSKRSVQEILLEACNRFNKEG